MNFLVVEAVGGNQVRDLYSEISSGLPAGEGGLSASQIVRALTKQLERCSTLLRILCKEGLNPSWPKTWADPRLTKLLEELSQARSQLEKWPREGSNDPYEARLVAFNNLLAAYVQFLSELRNYLDCLTSHKKTPRGLGRPVCPFPSLDDHQPLA